MYVLIEKVTLSRLRLADCIAVIQFSLIFTNTKMTVNKHYRLSESMEKTMENKYRTIKILGIIILKRLRIFAVFYGYQS